MARESSSQTSWDVVVVGAGPAGASISNTLARLGRRVLLLDRRIPSTFKLGETIAPGAIGLVTHFLGDLEAPGAGFSSFYKTAGNVSQWAGDQPDGVDFFFASTGFGICIDRLDFDAALRASAIDAGATLLTGDRLVACTPISDGSQNWELALTPNNERHRARYLVDCSGRNAAVAQILGAQTHRADRLFAFAQWFYCSGEDADRYTRIEAAPYGWWYSSRLVDGERSRANGWPSGESGLSREAVATWRIVVLQTDDDLPEAKIAASARGFDELLAQTSLIGPMLRDCGYRAAGAIRGAPACSQKLSQFCGDAWLAAGDAAQAYDPLSSQGIEKALRSASHAAHMIHYALQDCEFGAASLGAGNQYIRQYDEQQAFLWDTYKKQHQFYYATQLRWPNAPFWQRRGACAHRAVFDAATHAGSGGLG